MAQQKIKIVTPKATCVYPWLNKPDTKFNADGEYKVTLKVEIFLNFLKILKLLHL